MSLVLHAPTFSPDQASEIARKLFGISRVEKQLASERDQNFLLIDDSEQRFVLKIANAQEQRSLLQAQNEVMSHLQNRVPFCPRVVPTDSGDLISEIFNQTVRHYVRLLTYLPGQTLAGSDQTPQLLFELGRTLGQLTIALADFNHPAFHRSFHWDLAVGMQVISEYRGLIRDENLRYQIDTCLSSFEKFLLPRFARLPHSIIHGDANDYNVLVDDGKILGLIDFGDMVYSVTVGELAIALAYVILDKPDPVKAARELVAGYTSERPLSEEEKKSVWWLMLMRMCMSLSLAAFQQQHQPENEYLNISQRAIREALPGLLTIKADVNTLF